MNDSASFKIHRNILYNFKNIFWGYDIKTLIISDCIIHSFEGLEQQILLDTIKFKTCNFEESCDFQFFNKMTTLAHIAMKKCKLSCKCDLSENKNIKSVNMKSSVLSSRFGNNSNLESLSYSLIRINFKNATLYRLESLRKMKALITTDNLDISCYPNLEKLEIIHKTNMNITTNLYKLKKFVVRDEPENYADAIKFSIYKKRISSSVHKLRLSNFKYQIRKAWFLFLYDEVNSDGFNRFSFLAFINIT